MEFHLKSPHTSGLTYNPAYHRFTIFLSVCVFLLIVAGALVTSNDAGLAVPDWPTSFGSFYKIPPMVGGVKYEHGHRMIAQFVGFLTIILAIWTQRSDCRPAIRKLGWFALALVIAQGILGGLTVKMLLPWYVSTGHAMLAQTFFSLTILMSIFASRRWIETEPQHFQDIAPVGLRTLSLFALAAVYVQLFLGGAFRHGGMHFIYHIIGAGVATAILLWTSIRALTAFPQVRPIRAAASAILGLLVLQLVLGFGAYLTRIEWGKDAAQPRMSMVLTTVAHVAIGALLLAHCFMLSVQAYRYLSSRSLAPAVAPGPKVVTA
ncbi:MAG: putative Cytochrome oxidase assembly precursor [Acidobacteriaceae bacterium]|nr:putative Cytochrome oxidase assembly precursor [Acidobacteriaceae bacterium]